METTPSGWAVPVSTSGKEDPRPGTVKVDRLFTKEGEDSLDSVEWVIKNALLLGADGKEKFKQADVEVPATWSENTINIVAEKYFRVVDGKKETSAKQMFSRVAGWISDKGLEQGLLSKKGAKAFHDELLYILVNGMYAFNSPVWFNVGTKDDPQCSACFIQSVDDDMGSIMDLAKREVMLFKGGSGTGANLTGLRSSWEGLSGGGYASGPVSFMKGFDAFAGVTKSGGTTRRAAKINILNVDHPDIMEQRDGQPGFISCKADAEQEAHDLYETGKYSAEWNQRGNVYDRVGYQNANHSVRVTDEFMHAVEADGPSPTILKNGTVHKIYQAREIFEEIVQAAHKCGDPGLQFDTLINTMHTCKESGPIKASNPCSEYMFLDDSACNLGSLNLLKFVDGKAFKVGEFKHAVDIAIIAKEIIVDAASYPSDAIADASHRFRALGLGYANLGALLTLWGHAYDSDAARNVAASITALMAGEAYVQSAKIARAVGPFEEYEKNKHSMLRVIDRHLNHAVEGLSPSATTTVAIEAWREARRLGEKYGYRHAQTTLLAPTGTVAFLMGCDTTGIEPMMGVVVYKKIVGEGILMIPNGIVGPALVNLGYSRTEIDLLMQHITLTGGIHGCGILKEEHRKVFAGSLGEHSIRPEGHVDMVCAVQPFLSGSISKTVNMSEDATPQDVADIYLRAWKGGMKCVAIYRSDCKLSQPVATDLEHKDKFRDMKWGQRRCIPDTSRAQRHKFRIAQVKGYIHPGEYDNGELAEFFIRISKQGSFLQGMADSLATSVSLGLQHGVPLATYCEKFIGSRFEPAGFTGHEGIGIAHSLVDYLFRWLKLEYLDSPVYDPETGDDDAVKEPIPVVDISSSFDGPPCTNCGALTKRSGVCYVCSNCGETTGCS